MARKYRYQDLDGIHDISDKDISDIFYEYWCKQMKKAGREAQINEEDCINDFLVVHYGWKVKDE